jgi:hypothetical protein
VRKSEEMLANGVYSIRLNQQRVVGPLTPGARSPTLRNANTHFPGPWEPDETRNFYTTNSVIRLNIVERLHR